MLTGLGFDRRDGTYRALAHKHAGYSAPGVNNRLTTPLFNTELFTKDIEAAYSAMYKRYHADLPPDHIYVRQ
jgi:hypothetical protein